MAKQTIDKLPKKLPENGVILRYNEIALKKGNRGWFEKVFVDNTRMLLDRATQPEEEGIKIHRRHGRVIVSSGKEFKLSKHLERSFGLANYSPARIVNTDLDVIAEAAIAEFKLYVEKNGMPASFRVETKRSEKAIPLKSTEIDMQVGGKIKALYDDLKVNLSRPEMTVGIEVRFEQSFVWSEKIKGPGGLPVGSNSKVMTLISGGLDSPIAAINVMKRGSANSFIHFHGTPFVGDEVLNKVEDLVRAVNQFAPRKQKLYVIPFGKVQEKIALKTNPKLRTLLYRRMMIRLAAKVAARDGAKALVTGESLGQVASQTVENLAVTNEVTNMPILRPLITYDKEDIINLAKKWNTYDVSIRPGADCCTLFADRHPTIRAEREVVLAEEAKIDIEALEAEALEGLIITPNL